MPLICELICSTSGQFEFAYSYCFSEFLCVKKFVGSRRWIRANWCRVSKTFAYKTASISSQEFKCSDWLVLDAFGREMSNREVTCFVLGEWYTIGRMTEAELAQKTRRTIRNGQNSSFCVYLWIHTFLNVNFFKLPSPSAAGSLQRNLFILFKISIFFTQAKCCRRFTAEPEFIISRLWKNFNFFKLSSPSVAEGLQQNPNVA
jgi:hypothetical protein